MPQLVAAFGSPVAPPTVRGMPGPTRLVATLAGEPLSPDPVDRTYLDAGYRAVVPIEAGRRGPAIYLEAGT